MPLAAPSLPPVRALDSENWEGDKKYLEEWSGMGRGEECDPGGAEAPHQGSRAGQGQSSEAGA